MQGVPVGRGCRGPHHVLPEDGVFDLQLRSGSQALRQASQPSHAVRRMRGASLVAEEAVVLYAAERRAGP